MAVKVYLAANRLNLKLHFIWKSREDPIMQLVDKGSRGAWLDFDDFSLDADAIYIKRLRFMLLLLLLRNEFAKSGQNQSKSEIMDGF